MSNVLGIAQMAANYGRLYAATWGDKSNQEGKPFEEFHAVRRALGEALVSEVEEAVISGSLRTASRKPVKARTGRGKVSK